jgi:hypothetical protein
VVAARFEDGSSCEAEGTAKAWTDRAVQVTVFAPERGFYSGVWVPVGDVRRT